MIIYVRYSRVATVCWSAVPNLAKRDEMFRIYYNECSVIYT